jgi:phage terminase large subunit-like protein
MDRTTQYALDVLAGKIIAGELVKAACERHIKDVGKSEQALYKYYFDVAEAERILEFAETLTIAEGEEEQAVILFPFQCFILGNLNGWRTKEGNYRRFRTSYVQLGRQNGKSFLNGILATYYSNFDKYKYGQIYCTATKKEQAKIVFKEIVKFIRADRDLQEFFAIHEHNATIDCATTHSTIKALSGDTQSIDGFRPYLGIVDEYHAHKTNQMYKLLEGGIKMMKSALISVITTAGFDLKSPCFQLYEFCTKILKGAVTNETQFVYIAQIDEKDDIWKKENWIKANPILQYDSTALENLVPIAATAREMGGNTLRDFIVKQLNVWIQYTDTVYMKDMQPWDAGKVEKKLEDFKGQECYAGLDLSAGGDLTSLALVFSFAENGTKKYYVFTHSFMPERRVQEHIKTDKVPYDLWIKNGLITVTQTMGGIKTDYKYIISYLQKLIEQYDLKIVAICYDPHNASAFLTDLDALGTDCISISQSAKSLNDATVDFRLEILSGNVQHDGNEALRWSLANAKTTSNSFGEIKIEKEYNTERIDIVYAIIDAWAIAMKGEVKVDASKYLELWFEQQNKYFEGGAND